jgi:methylphosphotriester-DNA--protein-cysteine methyltransferase
MSARRAALRDAPAPGARLVLVTRSPALRRLAELPEPYVARLVDGWDALAAAAESAPPSLTLLADAYLGRTPSQGPAPRLRELMWRRPSIAVIAALPLREEWANHAGQLFEWGVSDVLDLELETSPAAVWQRLRGTRARPLKRRLEDVLSSYASEYARNLVRAACETAVDGGGAADLAAIFGVEARTASAWCRREGLPPPRRLLAWTRVLLAATLLEEDGRSVVNVARCAGYATDHALRRAMRELAGGDPSTVERTRLFDRAAERFNAELREHRERVREQRRASRGAPLAVPAYA